ncbi:ROK family protein [Streptomyces sp. NPDC088197]|uniref:ROK family protein n=1 Tax=Streptomyces sp. NPDC088197 TaxID=3365840 RepID=UPI003829E6E1
MTLLAGVDIGGTKTAAALVTPEGVLLDRATLPTPARQGPAAVLDTAARAVTLLGRPVDAVGVGSAGVIDPGTGRVRSATSALPGWGGTDLRGLLAARLGLPVGVDNDVNAHALGEYWRGAAAGHACVLLLTVGTGVGGCVLIDGRVHHGAGGAAGEAGHLPVPAAAGLPCPCGGVGHVEAAASGPAMTAAYRELAGARPGHGTGAAPATLRLVNSRAQDGDPTALTVLRAGATALGEAVGGLVNVLAPDLVLLGGGVSRCGPVWWDTLRTTVASHLVPAVAGTPLRAGSLGDDAALYGAALLGREALA